MARKWFSRDDSGQTSSRQVFSRRVITALSAVLIIVLGNTFYLGQAQENASASTIDAIIPAPAEPGSTDQVQLDTTLYLPQKTPAPAILLPHGFGGSKNSVAGQARELAERGFVVLAYSARGFGASTGKISLNDPDREVADARKLVDYLAERGEVIKDNGDPRVAITGGSYGGALALLAAGTDKRIDAIAPIITYNDLAQGLIPNNAGTGVIPTDTPAAGAFSPNGVFKKSWAAIFFSAGVAPTPGLGSPNNEAPEAGDETEGSETAGAAAPSAPNPSASVPNAGLAAATLGGPCGRFTDEICRAYTELATTGRASAATVELLQRVSPASVTKNITIPTLLVQGENDTLFGLDQADATARQVTQAGGTVDMIWYAGGHDGGSPGPQLRTTMADWLWNQLDTPGQSNSSDKRFFRYDIQGSFRTSGAPSVRTVEAANYPGLGGGAPVERKSVPLDGDGQIVVNPPGGSPASVSGIPGFNGLASSSSRIAGLFSLDPPGQSVQFTSAPVDSQLLITGSSIVNLQITPVPEIGLPAGNSPETSASGNEAVLFVKLYDVGPDGARTLPANAIAPIRIPTSAGGPTNVTVTLPPVVRPVESGHSLQLVVSTTDQAYYAQTAPAAYLVSLAGPSIFVPTVAGTAINSSWPIGQIIGIAAVIAIVILVAVIASIRRRRAQRMDPALSTVPLVIDNLTKSYPGGVTAVKDLSFRVEKGQVLGLLGPNGAGKTTTLRMLMGLVTPTHGDIRVFGHRITPGAPVLSRIGSFVEGSGFLPHLSGAQNLELYWDATGRPKNKAHVAETLEIAGLGDAIHRKVRTYSQGMRQRLAIAQAMLGLPELLVLDEPTNGLDPPQIHQMREVLRRYADTGRTVLVSSHLLAEVEQTCSHVVVMHRGSVVAAGEVSDIVAAGGEATFRVDDAEAAATALRAIPEVSDVETSGDSLVHVDLGELPRSDAIVALVNAGVAVHQAGPRRRLEDVFLQLVGEDAGA